MNFCSLSFDDHIALPGGVSALLSRDSSIQPFISAFSDEAGFATAISTRSHPAGRRKIVAQLLEEQHRNAHAAQKKNARLIENENCFTVCTGHQLNVFTGPAFFVYKIVHTIKLAQQLNEKHPDKQVIPVYWMASEDHDFEEINHLYTRSKRLEWAREAEGAVGQMTTARLDDLASELLETIDAEKRLSHRKLIEEAATCATLSDCIRTLVNGLFGQYGILVLDADHPELKRLFAPVLSEELFNPVSARLIEEQSDKLVQQGFIAPVNPRPINLFLLSEKKRERIEITPDGFKAGAQTFTSEAFKKLLQANPERFSPNVVLRPLYQEYILPNLAYIGGSGELSYWLQLKPLFDHYTTPFPLLMLRNSAVYFTRREAELLNELQLTYGNLFEDEHQLIKRLVLDGEEEDVFFAESKAKLAPLYDAIAKHLSTIDPTLEKRVLATWARHEKDIDGLEKSGIKARKVQSEVQLNRLHKLREVLYPDGIFQERRTNFFQLQALTNEHLIEGLLNAFDGFNPLIHIISSST